MTHTHAIKINVIHDILAWRREHQPEPALGRGRVCASKVPAIPRTDFWKLFANSFYFILHHGPGPWAFPLGLVGSLLRASTFLGTFQYVPRLRPKPAHETVTSPRPRTWAMVLQHNDRAKTEPRASTFWLGEKSRKVLKMSKGQSSTVKKACILTHTLMN